MNINTICLNNFVYCKSLLHLLVSYCNHFETHSTLIAFSVLLVCNNSLHTDKKVLTQRAVHSHCSQVNSHLSQVNTEVLNEMAGKTLIFSGFMVNCMNHVSIPIHLL